MTATIEKTQFQNNFGGWLGVVIIDPKGQDRGASVEPDGKVWLSEAEQRLTANAPKDPKDNPFIEQEHVRRNETTGELETYTVTPLTVCSDSRYVPADVRPIPATSTPIALQHAQAAARGEDPVLVTEADAPAFRRTQQVTESGPIKPGEPPVAPRRAAQSAAAAQAGEETAQESDGGETPPSAPEETVGTATPPQGPAPEGTYVSGEEVGTPVQTQADSTETGSTGTPDGGDPAPWQG